MRKITVYATKGASMKTIESDATEWEQLERELRAEGYDTNSLHATENINRTDLINAKAKLPEGDFTVFLRPKKTKSGSGFDDMGFRELRACITTQDQKDYLNVIAKKSGRNWTQLSTDELRDGLKSHAKKAGKSAPTTAKATPTKKAPIKATATPSKEKKKTATSGESLLDTLKGMKSTLESKAGEMEDSGLSDEYTEMMEILDCSIDSLSGPSEEEIKAQKEAEARAKRKAELDQEAEDLMAGY